jgi:hypothetical protein
LLDLLDFEALQAHFISINTTSSEIIQILEFEETTYSPEKERTKELLYAWLRRSGPDILSKFLISVSGRPGLTDGLKLLVRWVYLFPVNVKVVWKYIMNNYNLRSTSSLPSNNEDEPLGRSSVPPRDPDLWPKFNVCGNQVEMPGWPIDKTEDEFMALMDWSVIVCSDGDAWTVS